MTKKYFFIFLGGLPAGLFLGYGIPDESTLLINYWNILLNFLRFYFSPEFSIIIGIVTILVILAALILFLSPIISAVIYEFEGLISFLLGMLAGGIIAIFIPLFYFILILIGLCLIAFIIYRDSP